MVETMWWVVRNRISPTHKPHKPEDGSSFLWWSRGSGIPAEKGCRRCHNNARHDLEEHRDFVLSLMASDRKYGTSVSCV
jgi:hypothetical protein